LDFRVQQVLGNRLEKKVSRVQLTVNGGENKDFRVQSLVNDGCFEFMSKERVPREKKRASSSKKKVLRMMEFVS
jgi:hypothetical protein